MVHCRARVLSPGFGDSQATKEASYTHSRCGRIHESKEGSVTLCLSFCMAKETEAGGIKTCTGSHNSGGHLAGEKLSYALSLA